MNRYICIHGHFYQPPRENPWIDEIEPEYGAYPFHDWNELITAQCYVPNASSRILGKGSTIVDIVHNYAQISFNFGPTLLSWIEKHKPDLYDLILLADRESQRRFSGHGSAIAQVYNHIIMPLASKRDKETEIIWGIRDFVSRFHRRPEGMWLAETAVDSETLDILAEQGILFTILSPDQAKRTRKLIDGIWQPADSGGLDIGKPYLCRLPSGRSITLFFYDHVIASEIAFGSLLENGERFVNRLISAFPGQTDHPYLLNVATDGETYGHHHRFADMALAYALHRIESKNLAKITIYGEYLEKCPPVDEVEIYENSSWSCSHGVGRWYRDCGCCTYHACLISNPDECITPANKTPPFNPRLWNQKWRGPLREAMNLLSTRLADLFQHESSGIFSDPWAARNDYIDLILDRSENSVELFLSRHKACALSPDLRIKALRLLEIQRNALLMYTSCGWFFDEITGIETVQVMMYAHRAMQLAREVSGIDHEPEFTAILSRSLSNIPDSGSGLDIYTTYVRPAAIDVAEVACFYAIRLLFTHTPAPNPLYTYTVHDAATQQAEKGTVQLVTGHAVFHSIFTGDESHLFFASLHLGSLAIIGGSNPYVSPDVCEDVTYDLRNAFDQGDIPGLILCLKRNCKTTIPLRKIFPAGQSTLISSICDQSLAALESESLQRYGENSALIRSMKAVHITPPEQLTDQMQSALNGKIRMYLETYDEDLHLLAMSVDRLMKNRLHPDIQRLSAAAERRMYHDLNEIRNDPMNIGRIRQVNEIFEILKPLALSIDFWNCQNLYFSIHSQFYDQVHPDVMKGDQNAKNWMAEMQILGIHLSVVYSPALPPA